MLLDNLKYPFLTVLGKLTERKIAPALILTLILNQILTLTGGQFSSGAIFGTPFLTYAHQKYQT